MAEQNVMMFELSEIAFKYERATAIADVLEMLLAEGPVEIRGLPEHAVQDTLFQITEMLHDSNDDMKKTSHGRIELIIRAPVRRWVFFLL